MRCAVCPLLVGLGLATAAAGPVASAVVRPNGWAVALAVLVVSGIALELAGRRDRRLSNPVAVTVREGTAFVVPASRLFGRTTAARVMLLGALVVLGMAWPTLGPLRRVLQSYASHPAARDAIGTGAGAMRLHDSRDS